MLYLVDSSILIDAKRQYYQFYRVPEYWKWLEFHAKDGKIKIPWQIFEEVTIKSKEKDQLDVWVRKNKDILVLDESISEQIFKDVIDKGYAPDLSDSEYEKLGGDPFLIAYALSSKQDRIIVTSETSKSSLKREKRMIPNVCETFGIRCVKQWELIEDLDFRTDFDKK